MQVRANGRSITLGERKQRLVLAALLLEPNRLVPVGRLVDLLWRESPPSSARRIVQAHLSRLRTILTRAAAESAAESAGDGSAGRGEIAVIRRGAGYELVCDPDRIDAHRFRALLDRAWHSDDLREKLRLLRQALALWQGPALADAATDEVRDELCRGLNEARLAALEERFDAELRLGHDRRLIDELIDMTARHPFRQRFTGFLMLALYRAGRAAEALTVYSRARQLLNTELGLEPSAELKQIQVSILREDPALFGHPADRAAGAVAVAVPSQLPADVPDFVGRLRELRWLDGLAGAGAPPVAVVTGVAGVGKTALTVHWAHRRADRFPDGQLYVDLRGHAAGPPVSPAEALTSMLRALGAAGQPVPADLASAAALYRTAVAGRRLVVVLDDASTAEQVRPLLPGSPSCTVVVTSRSRLDSLVAREGARQLDLGVLAEDEAHDLIRHICGAGPVRAARGAAASLASLCGYLPLALRIATTNVLTGRHAGIADCAARIATGDRLAELQLAGDEGAGVAAALARSYAGLTGPARQLFRMFGVVPGSYCPVEALPALTGTSAELTDRQLYQLTDVHLVEQRDGRIGMHPLVRCYAERRLVEEDGPDLRRQAMRRLVRWYLERAEAALQGLGSPAAPERPAGESPVPRASAQAWFRAEQSNLVALVLRALADPALIAPPLQRLAEILYTAYFRRGRPLPAAGPAPVD
ncbi:MAG TPA: AfsR/SARP family transcriptional regulator [Natronosporangium sp.]